MCLMTYVFFQNREGDEHLSFGPDELYNTVFFTGVWLIDWSIDDFAERTMWSELQSAGDGNGGGASGY